MTQRTNEANDWGASFVLSVHTNAFDKEATGFESFIYTNVGETTKIAQRIIHDEIVKVAGLKDRGKKQGNLHMVRESRMPALLTENGFIDNPTDAKLMKDLRWIAKVARAHAEGIAKAFNLPKKTSVSGSNIELYKVQIGAFSSHNNATRLANELKEKGYDTYVVKD